MVKCLLGLLLFLLIADARAQQISGTLKNIDKKQALIVISYDDVINNRVDTLFPNGQGNFNINLKLLKPGHIRFKIKDMIAEDLYVFPNCSLVINADGKNASSYYSTVTFKGTAGFINNFFLKIQRSPALKKKNAIKKNRLAQHDFLKAVTASFAVRDSIKRAYFEKMSIKPSPELKEFLARDSIDMVYDKAWQFFLYLDANQTVNKSEFFKEFLQPLQMQTGEDRFLNSPSYRFFWVCLMEYKLDAIRRALPEKEARSGLPYYKHIPELISSNLSGKIEQIVAAYYLGLIELSYNGASAPPEVVDEAVEKLFGLLNDKKFEQVYRPKFDVLREFKANVKTGAAFKDFTAIDATGKQYRLNDFKGKIVYIDLWASWCGPCIAEIPYGKKMMDKIKDPDKFIYLSISTDQKKEDWLKGMQRFNPPGLNLWVEGGFNSKLTKAYNILGIPQFILIDATGKLIKFHAPSPSSGDEIVNMINNSFGNL